MKTRLRILELLVVLCSAFATTAVFGQTTYTWTGAADGTNLAAAGNWNPVGVPVPANSDILEWNGLTNGPLVLTPVGSVLGAYASGNVGLNFYLTGNQTNSVQIGTQPDANAGTIRLNGITIDPGAGPFTLGDSSQQYFVDIVWGGAAGQNHEMLNDSTNPATFYPNVLFRNGGGGVHHFIFDGSGDWDIRHCLITSASSGTAVNKLGSGTMYWTGTNIPAIVLTGAIISPVTLNEGRIVLQTCDLLSSQGITDNGGIPTVLEYRATGDRFGNPGQGNLSGIIDGPVALVIDAGTFTLAGANTYTGNTTINGGKLVFQGTMTGTGNITVADGAALGVTDTGTQVAPSTLNLGTSGGCTLEFNNVNSTTTAPLVPDTLSSAGTITVNINSGTFTVGQSYPLLTWTSGSGPAVSLGVLNGFVGNLSFTGNTLELNITALVAPPTLDFTNLGNSLQFLWTSTSGTFKLQSQTNSLALGLGTNWVDYPGGDTSPVTVPMDGTQDAVFFRLVSAP